MKKLEKCLYLIKEAIKIYPTEETVGIIKKIISDHEKTEEN